MLKKSSLVIFMLVLGLVLGSQVILAADVDLSVEEIVVDKTTFTAEDELRFQAIVKNVSESDLEEGNYQVKFLVDGEEVAVTDLGENGTGLTMAEFESLSDEELEDRWDEVEVLLDPNPTTVSLKSGESTVAVSDPVVVGKESFTVEAVLTLDDENANNNTVSSDVSGSTSKENDLIVKEIILPEGKVEAGIIPVTVVLENIGSGNQAIEKVSGRFLGDGNLIDTFEEDENLGSQTVEISTDINAKETMSLSVIVDPVYGEDENHVNNAAFAAVKVKEAVGRVNLLANPGFEDGEANWSGFTSRRAVADEGYTGSKSWSFSGGSTGGKQVLEGLKPNTTYLVSGWAKLEDAPEDASAEIGLYVRDEEGQKIQVLDKVNSSEWTYLQTTLTTPPVFTDPSVFAYYAAD
ncbi:MAG: carbohydrate binding domain-containing protein, partial [Halanaerobiales bacterium]